MGSYFLMSEQSGYLRQILFNLNARCLSIISMHHREQKMLYYIILMNVSIGTQMKIYENGLLKI